MRITLIIFLFSFILFPKKLEKIEIGPLNRAYFYFNVIPEYSSQLNEQKNRLTLEFKSTEINENAKQITSTGIIKEIQTNINNADIETIITLSQEDKGFTILPLPYSSGLMIDFFSWSKLGKGEKELKLAIFGIEGEIESLEEINSNLDISIQNGVSEAKAIKGLYQLSKGIAKNTSELIFSANKDSVKIPDLYAGISIILKSKGEDTLSKKYLDIFTTITGKTQLPELLVDDMSEITIPEYFYPKKEISSIVQKDSLNIPLEDTRTRESLLDSMGFNPTYIIFFAFAVLLFFVLIYLNYLRWKKNQLVSKELGENKFKEELRKKKEESEKKIQEHKKKLKQQGAKQEQKPVKKSDSKKTKAEPNASANVFQKKYSQADIDNVELKQKKVKPADNIKEVTNKEKLEDFLTDYIPVKRKLEEESQKDKIQNEINEIKSQSSGQASSSSSSSPNMDLALKIASEKQKSKQEQILNLSKQEIKDKQDLEDKAKDLGIEKGSIEARSSIDNLSADESSLSKLRGRFSVNKESDNQKEDEN